MPRGRKASAPKGGGDQNEARIVEAVGTAGGGGNVAGGLGKRIEEAMSAAAAKAMSEGAPVEAQRAAMQDARRTVVKEAAEADARARDGDGASVEPDNRK